jgi:hypothetical protein
MPFKVKFFKVATPNGRIEWIISNDLSEKVNAFVAEQKKKTAGRLKNSTVE